MAPAIPRARVLLTPASLDGPPARCNSRRKPFKHQTLLAGLGRCIAASTSAIAAIAAGRAAIGAAAVAAGEAFIAALLADWQEHGAKAIERVRLEKPEQYLKVIASILPKDITVGPIPPPT